MKSMNEIINSIKDEKLRRFAIGLKEKLEVAFYLLYNQLTQFLTLKKILYYLH